jgi:hypothetical protein
VGTLGEKANFNAGFNSHGDRVSATRLSTAYRVVFEQASDASRSSWSQTLAVTIPSSGVGTLEFAQRGGTWVTLYLVTPYRPVAFTANPTSGGSRVLESTTTQVPGTTFFASIVRVEPLKSGVELAAQVKSIAWENQLGYLTTLPTPHG